MMILQSAYAQTVRDRDDNKWILYSPKHERLGSLPAILNAQPVMNILNLARVYELQACHAGVAEGLRRGQNAADLRVAALTADMDALANENIRLSGIIEAKLS